MGVPETQIVVAITAGAPELRGTVRVAEAPAKPFTGWLGLLSALQVAVEAEGAINVELA